MSETVAIKKDTRVIAGITMTFRTYDLAAEETIEDESFDGQKFQAAKRRNLTIFYSLESWDLKKDGKPVELTLDNFYRHFPRRDKTATTEAYLVARSVNTLTDDEKKTSQPPSVPPSTGQ